MPEIDWAAYGDDEGGTRYAQREVWRGCPEVSARLMRTALSQFIPRLRRNQLDNGALSRIDFHRPQHFA